MPTCGFLTAKRPTHRQREFGGSPVAFYDPALGIKQLFSTIFFPLEAGH